MLDLSQDLEGEISVYINKSDRSRLSSIISIYTPNLFIEEIKNISQYTKIIVDKRDLEEELYIKYLKGQKIIAIDEGGKYRSALPFLIDILPLPHRFVSPNVSSISFLKLPAKKNIKKNDKILVSFGGEDPSLLTEKFCREISDNYNYLIKKITIVLGPLYTGETPDKEFEVIENPSSLHDIMAEYAGVICSFGITAFEANSLDIPVLLINPGVYHEELAEIIQFNSAGVVNADFGIICDFIKTPGKLKPIKMTSLNESLGHFINNLEVPDSKCPVCSQNDFKIVARFKKQTYCRCGKCSVVYLLNYQKQKMNYNEEYFFNQYEHQYGKTYLEDFYHLSEMAEKRLKIIKSLKGSGKTILDVGCAYGPFLKKAKEMNFSAYGTDISKEAVLYVQNKMKFNAVCSEFDTFYIPESWKIHQFDLLSMWYVIEHFKDLSSVLKKVNSLLKPGGLFAFSTPNGTGISSFNNQVDFLNKSPDDHYTIWEPGNSQKILEIFGFKIKKIKITGHHPERFISPLTKWGAPGRWILHIKSKIFRLGDTYEIYAEKVREL